MAYSIGVVCSVGVGADRGGRNKNEDNYLICVKGKATWREGEAERTEAAEGVGCLLSVCDGLGGHDDGDVASTAAARVMAKLYRPGVPQDPARVLLKYIRESHRRLYWRARDKGPVQMGTTMSVCWLVDDRMVWAQVGDSRIYLFRKGRLTQVTIDQTRNEFARRDGGPQTSDGNVLAQSFIFGSRGQGDNSALRLEMGLDVGVEIVEKGDRILLCTDGLWGSVDAASIADVLRHVPDPQAASVACMERAIARGSTDNISVIVVRIDSHLARSASSEMWEDDEDETLLP